MSAYSYCLKEHNGSMAPTSPSMVRKDNPQSRSRKQGTIGVQAPGLQKEGVISYRLWVLSKAFC
jgi:hypothetical protein